MIKYILCLLLFALCCVNAHACSSCLPTIKVTYLEMGTVVFVQSSKDLSHVVLQFCDGSKDVKFDNLKTKSGYFSFKAKEISVTIVKSGCNGKSGWKYKRQCNPPPPPDCLGVPGGSAIYDDHGVCCLPTAIDECGHCYGDNSTCADCFGVPNGGAVVDLCGVCEGDNSTCADCFGVPNGGAVVDLCGVCDGDGTSCIPTPQPTNTPQPPTTPTPTPPKKPTPTATPTTTPTQPPVDCFGVPDGTATIDRCGICGGSDGDLVKIEINKLRLLRQQQHIVNRKTLRYFNRMTKCQPNLKSQLQKNIILTKTLHEQYRVIVDSLITEVRLCLGECADQINKNQLTELRLLSRKIYRQASKAQRGARKACATTTPGVKETIRKTKKLIRDINRCDEAICR